MFPQGLRTQAVGQQVLYGLQGIYADEDSFILDAGDAMHFRHFWPLCSQAVFLSGRRALVFSDAAVSTWIESMDELLQADDTAVMAKLRWKSNAKHNGRTLATPTATGGSLVCLLYTSPSPRDKCRSRMPSSA